MHIEIEVLPTVQFDRLMAFRADIGLALGRAAVAYRAPIYEGETNEARAETIRARLWDELLVALVAAFDGSPAEMLTYAADALGIHKPTHVAGIPIIGTIVDDPIRGNRVVWDGGSKAARPDSLL